MSVWLREKMEGVDEGLVFQMPRRYNSLTPLEMAYRMLMTRKVPATMLRRLLRMKLRKERTEE